MKMYILVRKDLSQSQQAVQACHAAAQLVYHFHNHPQVQEWAEKHQTMVILGVEDEEDLKIYANAAEHNKQLTTVFYEPDISSYTAMATIPEDGRVYKHLRLL